MACPSSVVSPFTVNRRRSEQSPRSFFLPLSGSKIEHVQRWLPERQTALCGVLPTAISTGAFRGCGIWAENDVVIGGRAGQIAGLEVQPPMANPLVVHVDLYCPVLRRGLLRWKWRAQREGREVAGQREAVSGIPSAAQERRRHCRLTECSCGHAHSAPMHVLC